MMPIRGRDEGVAVVVPVSIVLSGACDSDGGRPRRQFAHMEGLFDGMRR